MMANTIREPHDASGRTLAILGNRRTNYVAVYLSDDLVDNRVELAYSLKSWRGLREIAPKLMVSLYLIVSVWFLSALLGNQLVVPLLTVLLRPLRETRHYHHTVVKYIFLPQ